MTKSTKYLLAGAAVAAAAGWYFWRRSGAGSGKSELETKLTTAMGQGAAIGGHPAVGVGEGYQIGELTTHPRPTWGMGIPESPSGELGPEADSAATNAGQLGGGALTQFAQRMSASLGDYARKFTA